MSRGKRQNFMEFREINKKFIFAPAIPIDFVEKPLDKTEMIWYNIFSQDKIQQI